jgi:GT2 family glycosyltransferase
MLAVRSGDVEMNYKCDLTASIVAYQTDPEELAQAVRCCQSSRLVVEVIVVDNSPSPDLSRVCLSLGARYVYPGKNVGFGTAHNIAFRSALTAKYHLVMNPDVTFEGTALEELVAFLEMNECVGLAMPRVLYPDGSVQNLCKRLPSPLDIVLRRLSSKFLGRVFQKRLAAFELRSMDRKRVLSVPYLSGCFMMFRRKALQEVEGFDQRFFMYFEDLDLTRRIHERYATVYYPGVTIVHKHGKGSYKSARLLYCGIESAVRYFNKWGWVADRERNAINIAAGPLELFCPEFSEPAEIISIRKDLS